VENSSSVSNKSRMTYVLLGIFLGGFGVHNFYAKRTVFAVLQLALTILALVFSTVAEDTGSESFDDLGNLIWIGVLIWVLVELFVIKEDASGAKFR